MATLKISDLSVGDWVQDNYGDYVKVAGIWQGCNFNYQVDILRDGRIGTIVPCNLHPIPITVDILEKNWFFSDRLAGWYKCKLGDILRTRIEVHIGAVGVDRIEISSVDAFDEDWSTLDVMINKPIKGVHQLQHALRLAGVDKEINL